MADKINSRVYWIIFVVLLAIIGWAQGATITVGPGAGSDFSTIQIGIDAANDGDTVLVAPSEYVITEPITYRGKAITVKSEAGPDETTIRMATPTDTNRGSVLIFENNETDASVLEGFMITDGKGSWVPSVSKYAGGGIYFNVSSGTVKNCIFIRNTADPGGGGGVSACFRSSPILTNCIFMENSATWGGGAHCWDGSHLTLMNCTVAENSAGENSGGVYCMNNSSATITECTISRNSAKNSAGIVSGINSSVIVTNSIICGNSAIGSTPQVSGYGGGVECWDNSSMVMTNCIITENTAGRDGGAVFCETSSVTMTNCKIVNNTANHDGGGMECVKAPLTLTNCLIAQNTAANVGGGLACGYADSFLTIKNCTICGNSACTSGGGVKCWLGSTEITNSIIWANMAPQGREISVENAGTLSLTYSNVAGGRYGVDVQGSGTLNWDEGNIDANPLFAESGYWADVNDPNVVVEPDDPNAIWIDGDYHLKSEVGRWDPYSESWIMDDVTSPCIDRGDPYSLVGDEPDPNGGIINMGAYGGTPEASMSIGQLPPLPPLAHWKLNETGGDIAYESVGNNHGILNGSPTWQPVGDKVGGALQFDGIDDYVSTPFILNPGEVSFSATAWIQGGAPGQVIISQADTEGQSAIESGSTWLGINPSNEGLMTGLMDIFFGPLESESLVADEQWHHVGLVYDFNTMKRHLYVEGAEVAVDADFVGGVRSTAGLYIGAGQTLNAASFFSGLIDDVRIYNKALTAEEIAVLAQ